METESDNAGQQEIEPENSEGTEMDVDQTVALVNIAAGETKSPKFKKREFNPEDWELVDEDECIVELVGMLNRDYLQQCDKDRVKIVGLFNESGKVFLQLDKLVFTGEPSETFGTNVLFEEYSDSSSDEEDTFTTLSSDVPERKIKLKYVTNTRKKITMSRAFLSKKTL